MNDYSDIERFIQLAQETIAAKDADKNVVSRKFAIALHFGMKKFGLPTSKDKTTRNNEEIEAIAPLWRDRSYGSKFRDIPPTLPLWMLVVAFAREAMAIERLHIDIRQMSIKEHGKTIDVGRVFADNYCYIILYS